VSCHLYRVHAAFSFIVLLTSIVVCHRYTGSNCQYRINECDSHPCLNGATCHDQIKYYTCHCPYGYTGKRCDSYVDWCSTEPCMNQATCKQTDNMYTCVCGPGWTGKVCDVEMVSCSDAAIRKGWCLSCNDVGTTCVHPTTMLTI
jgi:hypothetical protein